MTDTTKPDACQQVWRTMDSAPLDGTEVLLQVEKRAGISGRCLVGHYMPGGHCIEDHPPIDRGWYFWDGREFDHASRPTAWMPIPAITPASIDDRLDAERYRWLRQQHWDTSRLFVVTGPKPNIQLGTDCPSLDLLDRAIDVARGAPEKKDLQKGEGS